MFVKPLKTRYLRFPGQMVWLLEYFIRMWEICVQFFPPHGISASTPSLEEFLNSKLKDLSPFLLLQSARAFKHLLVQEPGTLATSHGLPLIKYRLICLPSGEFLVLCTKFCSVGICKWHREWQWLHNREISLLQRGRSRANHPWHAGHVDECLTRKYLDINNAGKGSLTILH